MKKAALTALQVLVTAGILFLVFRDPAKRAEMAHALGEANRGWLFAGFAAYGLVEICSGVRWQLLLRVQGIVLSWARVFMLLLVGVFFNFIIPGGTGGDVVKVFYLLKETPGRRSHALLSVLVDRLIGLFALIAMAGVLIAAQWHWLLSSPEAVKFIWVALAILGGSLAALGVSFLLTGFGLIHKLPARLPGRDKLAELALAYSLYGRAWKPTVASFVLSIGAHLGYFAMFFCAAASFGATSKTPTFGELCAIMPIINTITSMPISVGGLGVREKLFQVFLGDLCGVSDAVAALMSTTGYALNLVWGLLGGLLYLFYRPSEHARLREMRAEVATLEHAVAEQEIAIETAGKETP
ncbi:MAG: flippase-like domain-containing protein [Chthoniobacter sp.]|nr:flippase-like domain-containing protein [Chthoniobacter sp.]